MSGEVQEPAVDVVEAVVVDAVAAEDMDTKA
jgi:hypothetical protein